jgi:phospholipase/carboxylesterase
MAELELDILGPHHGQAILTAGSPLETANAVMLMMHGRGARAADILTLAAPLAIPGFIYLAPEAAEDAWYPNRFFDPLESNEPWLSSALSVLDGLYKRVMHAGIRPEKIILLGFSQGACLALEYAARNPRIYGGIAGLSGALIGPDGTPHNAPRSLAGTPIFLGCSDVDPHVSRERVIAAAAVLRQTGGAVTQRFYANMGHQVNEDEIDFVRGMMEALG